MADEFDRITATEDITRILKIAESANAEVYCDFAIAGSPPLVVELDIRGVIGTNVLLGLRRKPGVPGGLLSSVFKNDLKIGSQIEVVFNLVDGQYAIRDVVQDTSMATFTLSAGRNLMRLQRRKDFRVLVKTDGLKFVSKLNGADVPLPLIDLSAGGTRLLWPPAAGPIPLLGTILKGSLFLNDDNGKNKVVEVDLKFVKDHGPDSPEKPELGQAMSFQFQNIGQEQARAVLFTCLFIHRKNYGSR